MRGETLLDYAEFQLTPKRTRCELLISADGSTEKLASGFFKPFVTHLRAAELQIARGNQIIRLETDQGESPKPHHQQEHIKNAWFCKGTLERFVRFVSTPEVIERVKSIEDELTQLEQVRSALVHTFTQTPERFAYGGECGPGSQQRRDATEEDNGTDASKKELLRAMDARLTALHQEQQMAFSRATAAGFDDDDITNLMTFAEYFGADRLKDACTQFLALSMERTMRREGQKSMSPEAQLEASSHMLVPSEEAWRHGPKRRLDFGAIKLQKHHSDGAGAPLTTRDPKKEGSSGGTFFAHLHQMAQQVEGRSGEDFGWQMDSETNDESPPQGLVPSSAMWEGITTDELRNSTNKSDDLRERSSSLPALRVGTEVHGTGNSSPTRAANAEDRESTIYELPKIPRDMPGMDSDDCKIESAPGEMPARRLSVQAAISLFESKKKDSSDAPFRKLVKQESRKLQAESATSPSEKSVLKRWSVPSLHGHEENTLSDKKLTEISSLERLQDQEVKARDAASEISFADRTLHVPAPSMQVRENFKKSLNELLHIDSTQRNGRSKGANAEMQQIKQSSTVIQQPSDIMVGSNSNLESKIHTRQTKSNNEPHPVRTQEDVDVVLNSEAPPPVAPVPPPVPKPLKNAVKEPDWQPGTTIDESTDHSGKLEHEYILKGHNARGSSDFSSQRLKAQAQVSSQMLSQSSEQDNSGSNSAAARVKQEPTSVKKADFVKLQEVPGGIKQLAKSMSYGKTKVGTKESFRNIPLNTSVDLHMQALVKMVKHQCPNLSLNGTDILHDATGGQKGRFYDQYSKLRDAKIRREHPAKKAEREAKLKSMQETLERRTAEMESQGVRLSKKKALRVELGEKEEPRKSGLAMAMAAQKDLKDEEDDTDQDEPLRLPRQPSAYNNPTFPSKNRSLIKSHAPAKTLPALSKPSIAPRNSLRAANSSPKSTPKNLMAMPSQGKPPSQSNTNEDEDGTTLKANLNMKDVGKNSLTRAAGSARVHPRSNIFSSDFVVPGNEGSLHRVTEKKETRLAMRKGAASGTPSKSLPTEAGTVLASTKDKQEWATDSTAEGKVPQEAKPFLRKGKGIGPGAGPGVMKQKASISVDASKSSDEETSADYKEDGVALDCCDQSNVTVEDPESNEITDASFINEQDLVVASSMPISCTVDHESKSSNSRLSDSLEMEALDYLPESASENDKICHDTSTLVEGPREATAEDTNSDTQGSFLQSLHRRNEKEGSRLLSELLAQRNNDSPQHDASFVKSSISFREASLLPHGQIGNASPTSVSQDYSSILQRGAISSRFSPPRANLPLGSPALWHASHGSKYMAEPSIHSGRPLSGTQKHASALPLPPKEPSKGLKRLLHFGRKSRSSETTTDCVSVSTASEGDDDADEVKELGSQISDELLRKIRMQKKGFDYGNPGDHYSSADQESSLFSGSSIPPPPANFKLREEHLSGSNLIKAPSRSFFSLSSFRSKGSEGKSR